MAQQPHTQQPGEAIDSPRQRRSPLHKGITILLLGMALIGSYWVSLNNYLLFHSLAEGFSIVVAIGIFMVAWNTRRFHDNHFFLFLGIAYLFIGILDLFHALAYNGMGVFPDRGPNPATQLWIATRYLEALSLLIAIPFLKRTFQGEWLLFLYTVVTGLLLFSILVWDIFPDCFVPGLGLTPFKIISEYAISMILLASLMALFNHRHGLDREVWRLLAGSILLTILAEMAFTFYISVFGFSNYIGHMLKIGSFYLIYLGVIKKGLNHPLEVLTHDFRRSEEKFRAISQSAREAVISINERGQVTFWNNGAVTIFGFPPEEILGQSLDRIIPKRFRLAHNQALLRANTSGQTRLAGKVVELFGVRKTGEEFPIAISIVSWAVEGERSYSAIVRDITERKQLEGDLKKFRHLIDQSRDAIFVIDPDSGQFLDANHSAAAHLGYSREQLLTMRVIDIDGAITSPEQWQDHANQLREVGDLVFEGTHTHRDGHKIPVEISVRYLHTPDKPYLVASSRDITERKKLDQERDDTQKRLKHQRETLLHLAKNREIMAGDLSQSIRLITEAAARGLGVGRASVWLYSENRTAIRALDLFEVQTGAHSGGQALFKKDFPGYFSAMEDDRIIATNDAQRDPRTLEFRDPYLIPNGISALLDAPIRSQGDTIGVVCHEHLGQPRTWTTDEQHFAGSIADMVALAMEASHRLEAVVRQNNQLAFQQTLMETIPVPIFFMDTEGLYLGCNKAFELFLKESRENIIGKTVFETAPRDLAEEAHGKDGELLSTVGVQVYESEFQDARGERHNVIFHKASYTDAGGRISGLVGVILDISERKQMERSLLKASEEAKAANLAKSAFLAAMSHEIRTPLNTILGMNELLVESQLNPDQNHYVDISLRSGKALMSLINDILDLSKIEAGQMELYLAPFDFGNLLQNIIDILSVRAKDKGIDLKSRISPNIPLTVRGDQQRFQQVLINIIGNAIKFTETGSVVVKAEPETDGRLLLCVTDTGMGISEANQEVIFAPFSQADSSVAGRFGGTGLGLAISRHLVHQMGGEIWVKSQEGKGSSFCFTVRFPAVDSPETTTSTTLSERRALNRDFLKKVGVAKALSILLVEDNPDNRLLVKAFLKKTAHQITYAENGQIALEKFKTGHFHLVFMDIQMPVMDGYTATMKIRAWEAQTRAKPTPIIALTAHAMREVSERSRVAGCDFHLPKPISKGRLLGILDRFSRIHSTDTGDREKAG
ncbi:MAG: PAS domain S-box protein [Magnetococcales bacterium]|nr:PAS domain S-box protein [Magnetococcales bacterium]